MDHLWADTAIPFLEQLPNGGAVVAIMIMTWVFLKRQERTEETIKAVMDTFAAEVASSRKEYRDHVDAIMHMGLGAHQETRAAIRALDETLGGIRDAGTPEADPKPKPKAKESPR